MSLLRTLQRLSSMSAREVAVRMEQALAKKADTLRLTQPQFRPSYAGQSPQAGRFFFDQRDIPQRVQLILENVPGFEEDVLARAEQILSNQFALLGYGDLDYGAHIDWQLDVVSGKKAPFKPWPKIRYLDFSEVGDVKVTWELNRHQFMVTLAKAWLLTGEERYVRKLESLYCDWQEKNPYPLGINWASSLEVAFRSLSWIWVRELLGGCATMGGLRRNIERALGFNAWYIQRYLSTYSSPNTHLLGEAVALFFIGTLCPSLPKASVWREKGLCILLEHAETKVLDDGSYYERSSYYHVYALDFLLHSRILAGRNEIAWPEPVDEVLQRMLEHLSLLCQAGPPPLYGDDDGGRVFDANRNRAEHLSDPLAIGIALYRLPCCKLPGVRPTEEMLWMFGEDGVNVFGRTPLWESLRSASFPCGGVHVSHAGNRPDSQIVLNVGSLGGDSGGHGHADALSLTLNRDRVPLLVDSGTFNYNGPGGRDRDAFRATQAHNTVVVDGRSQAEPRSPFSWFRRPYAKVEAVACTAELDYIAASHERYSKLEAPVTHRRVLFGSRHSLWLVLDELVSDDPHAYDLYWHFAPGATVLTAAENECVIELGGQTLHVYSLSSGWGRSVELGWHSPVYGKKELAPLLRFSTVSPGAAVIATVLSLEPLTSFPIAIPVSGCPTGVVAYRIALAEKQVILICGNGASAAQIEGWETDAKFLYAVLDEDGKPSLTAAVQGCFARYNGESMIESASRSPYQVWRPTFDS